MADWKRLLHDILVADGDIDSDETDILRREIMADGVVDNEEVDFLVSLRNSETPKGPEFETFFFDALKAHFLADSELDSNEAVRLRETLLADGAIDANEKIFLEALKNCASKRAPEFDALYAECMK